MRVAVVALLIGCSGSASPEREGDPPDTGTASDGDTTETTSPDTDSGAPDTAMPLPDATPTGGCGKPAMSGVSNGSITVNGTMRKYVLSIPTGYDPSKPYLLGFGWHGRTGNGALFRTYSRVESAAANKAIFVYPDGLPVTDDPKDTGWVLTAAGRDIAYFDALLKELNDTLCIDSKRVVSFGHSFGGYMSNAVACHRSSAIRAIAPVASGGPFGACGSAVSAWIAHNADDAVVKLSEGTGSRDFWTKKASCATTSNKVMPDPCVAYDGCSVPVIWCQSATGGHGWPTWAGAGIWGYFSSL